MANARLLFIVKFRENYDGSCGYDGTPHSFGGLYHSALFVVQMLNQLGIWAKLVQVCDNNGIDAQVAKWKPTHVIIEALWVVPQKFTVLQALHPHVKWIVRCHSEIPFLAYEGIAMRWITDYVKFKSVSIASNSAYGARDFTSIVTASGVSADKVHFLPNWYPFHPLGLNKIPSNTLDVGCFGAIRPLKNQLIQALAAIEWARSLGQRLNFHINGRTEQGGESVVKNLHALLSATGNTLVQHPWQLRGDFLNTLAKLDVGMQVSFSETFDITAADTVVMGVPLVTSNEVVWSSPLAQAQTTNTASILAALERVTGPMQREIAGANLDGLREFSLQSEHTWKEFAH